jgi:hypothetical protein
MHARQQGISKEKKKEKFIEIKREEYDRLSGSNRRHNSPFLLAEKMPDS